MHHGAVAALSLGLFAASQSGCMTAVAAFQAENLGGETIVITTIDAEGEPHERVLSPIDDDGRLFVAANHWPRAWYRRALANPDVRVTRKGETTDYTAVPVSEAEREHLLDDSGFPAVLYVFTGFAPRQFLRLDPRQASSPPLRRSDTRPACRRSRTRDGDGHCFSFKCLRGYRDLILLDICLYRHMHDITKVVDLNIRSGL